MIDLQAVRQACEDFLKAWADDFENDVSHFGPSVQKLREALAE